MSRRNLNESALEQKKQLSIIEEDKNAKTLELTDLTQKINEITTNLNNLIQERENLKVENENSSS